MTLKAIRKKLKREERKYFARVRRQAIQTGWVPTRRPCDCGKHA